MTTVTGDLSRGWEWADYEMSINALVFKAASYLTDPVCTAHELLRRIQVVDALHPTAYRITNLARKAFLGLGLIVCASLSWTALGGIALRHLAVKLQHQPYIYYKGNAAEKQLPADGFSLLSWNICCNSGGYSISDAGVVPWSFRIDEIIRKIKAANPDVLSLYEVFDPPSAFYLYEQLKNEYSHFYFNIGPRAVGVNSGIFIAAKFEIKNPNFLPFPKEMLVGRTKNAEKGVFSFDIPGATIFSTHLQHSEECAYPTDEEILARKNEMDLIMEKVRAASGVVILTGDLNLDDNEYQNASWKNDFQKGRIPEGLTWGGDEFYATFVGNKRISPPLNYDYTLGINARIETSYVETAYDAKVFTAHALSDHKGVFSKIYA